MKDLMEAIREFDERDKIRCRSVNSTAFYSGYISIEDRLSIAENRILDAMQLISWIVGHVVELEEKANGPQC